CETQPRPRKGPWFFVRGAAVPPGLGAAGAATKKPRSARGFPGFLAVAPGSVVQLRHDPGLLVLERLWHPGAVGVEVLPDALELGLPALALEAEQLPVRLAGQLHAVQIDVTGRRQVADGRLHRGRLALHPADHPLQHPQVVAKSGPQEVAALALAEPVD